MINSTFRRAQKPILSKTSFRVYKNSLKSKLITPLKKGLTRIYKKLQSRKKKKALIEFLVNKRNLRWGRTKRKIRYPFRKRTLFIKRLTGYFNKQPVKRKRRTFFKRKLKKRFVKHIYFRYQIRQSRNNMFVTYLTRKGAVLFSMSCGIIGLDGPRRSTPFAAEQLGRVSGLKLSRIAKSKNTFIILKSALNRHVRGCISSTATFFAHFKGIVDLIPRPHNGLRARKLRRL